ncbi:receptor-like protein kinase HSL1 [Cryptomeria japonica]|uniref:receptor-like protein kinase HSL1 n=1 Tax=Cryptomeria japonica TaxID=3369 RepID=UPI0027DA9EBA|nr:receptor-like protein kinase HSL1 [Cryptomeria japonica]
MLLKMAGPAAKFRLCFFVFGVVVSSLGYSAAQSSQDALYLRQLKSGFDDPNGFFLSWNDNDASPCKWKGVTCDVTGNVTAIDLSDGNIAGEFPAIACRLPALRNLSLAYNNVNGSIREEDLGRCETLEWLDLSQNILVGELPDFISKLTNLQYLDLSSNNFSGIIPPGFGNLPKLQVLSLHANLLNSTVPAYLGNLTSLVQLNLAWNPTITGTLPPELGNLINLENLWVAACSIGGKIPSELGNLLHLTNFDISQNQFTGSIPESIAKLKNVVQIELYSNKLSGPIPSAMGDLKALKRFDASSNMLNGSIPDGFGSLDLESLNLYENNLTGKIPPGLGSLASLTELKLFSNKLTGALPENLGRNCPLETLDLATNQLSGSLPPHLCRMKSLQVLSVFSNQFSGALPETLGSCTSLMRVRLGYNEFNGTVPESLWGLSHLSLLELRHNKFEGSISSSIAGAKNLSQLDITGNKFSGDMPEQIGELWNITEIIAGNNLFSGNLPRSLVNLLRLARLDLGNNQITGNLLTEIESWQQLTDLNLKNNKLIGSIPEALGSLPVLTYLDLSGNELSGSIPKELGNLKLNTFNVSDNRLSGPVPSVLENAAYEDSFLGNPGLCSVSQLNGIATCGSASRRRSTGWLMGCIFALAGIILIVGLAWFYRRYRNFDRAEGKDKNKNNKNKAFMDKSSWMLTSFHRLGFSEYEILDCLDEDNVIGTGGAGKVYKATLSNGETVAVKRLWSSGKSREEADFNDNGFKAEVDTLGKIRHKNIVKLWCCCAHRDSNLLVYEYMPNGSLGDLLHGPKASVLDWPIRYRIAVGAAQGLAYLHHDCVPAIAHRDVKSNNILLDGDFVAHVADFGLAKILQSCGRGTDSMSTIAGSYGYIAPEYAYTLKVNEKSDIYSFGVVMLELVTGRRPVDPAFGENKDLVKWVCTRIEKKNALEEILDPKLVGCFKEEMAMVLKVALLCTSALPINRPSMRRVVEMLQEANPLHKAKGSVKSGKLSPYYYEEPSVPDSP